MRRLTQLGHKSVAELEHLGEVVAGVDVHDREREARRPEGLLGQAQQHDRVLAAGEQQHRPFELGGDLAHDEDRLRLERVEMGQAALQRAVDLGLGAEHRAITTNLMEIVEFVGQAIV